jgi:hypothetical protein
MGGAFIVKQLVTCKISRFQCPVSLDFPLTIRYIAEHTSGLGETFMAIGGEGCGTMPKPPLQEKDRG